MTPAEEEKYTGLGQAAVLLHRLYSLGVTRDELHRLVDVSVQVGGDLAAVLKLTDSGAESQRR